MQSLQLKDETFNIWKPVLTEAGGSLYTFYKTQTIHLKVGRYLWYEKSYDYLKNQYT